MVKLKRINEKYGLQDVVPQINSLAQRIYDTVIPISKEFSLLDSDNKKEADLEWETLYNKSKTDKDAKYLFDAYDYFLENGEVVVFSEYNKDILPSPISVKGIILDINTNQTGGFDTFDHCLRIYFSQPQFNKKINNYDMERLKQTLFHELTHAYDYSNMYYRTKAQSFIPSNLSTSDKKEINELNPYIFDVLYRLWNDSELNAQQITITPDLVDAIKDGIDFLKKTNPDHNIFSTIQNILSSFRNKIFNSKHDYSKWSNAKFKTWFINNSEKRLNKLLDKKLKNDYLLNNAFK